MKSPRHMEVMTIVHGFSEYCMCKSITSNLRLNHKIIARDRGRNSIQVTSVLPILKDARFSSLSQFKTNFPDVKCEKKKLIDFRLFIIMDVDDCTEQQKQAFISKDMFKDHWLYEYITPIYNAPDLEATMKQAKIEVTKKKDYISIFPTNHGDLDIAMAREFGQKLEVCKNTNLNEYVDYCISIAERNLQKVSKN